MRISAHPGALVSALALIAALAAPAGAEDGEVLEELRALRDRVQDLEDWKSRRLADDQAPQDGIRAAVREYLDARPQDRTPSGSVFAPRSLKLEIGGQLRIRAEKQADSYSRFDPDGGSIDDFVLGRTRVHFRAQVTEDVSVYVEFQDSRVWGTESGTASNSANVDLSQGYVDFDRVLGSDNLSVRVGRQAVSLSDERFVGALEWSNTGRRLDGVTATYKDDDKTVVGFAYRLAEGFIEPPGTLGPLVTSADNDTDVVGTWWVFPHLTDHSTGELFAIYLRSGIPGPSEVVAPAVSTSARGDTAFGTYGARFHGSDDAWDWDFQGAIQNGRITSDRLEAWAARGEIGYTLPDNDWKPRFAVEVDLATGEKRTDDGKREQFQVLLPTNHGYYGIHDYQAWSNTNSWAAHVSVKPSPTTKVKLSYWDFRLDETAGGWVSSSGAAIRPGVDTGVGTSLGQEIDLVVSWEQNDRVSWQFGWAHFMRGEFVRDTQGPERGSTDTDFLYLQTLISF